MHEVSIEDDVLITLYSSSIPLVKFHPHSSAKTIILTIIKYFIQPFTIGLAFNLIL